MKRPIPWMTVAFGLLAAPLLAFALWPLAQVVLSVPLRDLWATILEAEMREALALTFYASALATGIALVTGTPLAYLLARHDFPGKALVQGLIDLPTVLPHTAAGIALLLMFGRHGLLGRGFEAVGVRFVSAVPGIVVAMLFVSMPFLVNAAREGFAAVDPKLERAARTLGASPWAAFRKVALPLAWRSVLTGATLMWARGLSEFGAVMILAYHPHVASVFLFRRFESFGVTRALPVAAWIIFTSLGAFLVLQLVARRKGR